MGVPRVEWSCDRLTADPGRPRKLLIVTPDPGMGAVQIAPVTPDALHRMGLGTEWADGIAAEVWCVTYEPVVIGCRR